MKILRNSPNSIAAEKSPGSLLTIFVVSSYSVFIACYNFVRSTFSESKHVAAATSRGFCFLHSLHERRKCDVYRTPSCLQLFLLWLMVLPRAQGFFTLNLDTLKYHRGRRKIQIQTEIREHRIKRLSGWFAHLVNLTVFKPQYNWYVLLCYSLFSYHDKNIKYFCIRYQWNCINTICYWLNTLFVLEWWLISL